MKVHIKMLPRRFMGEVDTLDVDTVIVELEAMDLQTDSISEHLEAVNHGVQTYTQTRTRDKTKEIIDDARRRYHADE